MQVETHRADARLALYRLLNHICASDAESAAQLYRRASGLRHLYGSRHALLIGRNAYGRQLHARRGHR